MNPEGKRPETLEPERFESPIESEKSEPDPVGMEVPEPKRAKVTLIPIPKGFPLPFKQGTIFAVNGIVFRVKEVKRPKPNPRMLVEVCGLVGIEQPETVVEPVVTPPVGELS